MPIILFFYSIEYKLGIHVYVFGGSNSNPLWVPAIHLWTSLEMKIEKKVRRFLSGGIPFNGISNFISQGSFSLWSAEDHNLASFKLCATAECCFNIQLISPTAKIYEYLLKNFCERRPCALSKLENACFSAVPHEQNSIWSCDVLLIYRCTCLPVLYSFERSHD